MTPVEEALLLELRALEERLLDTAIRKTPSVVAELLADDFVEVASNGVICNKEQILAALEAEEPAVRSVSDFALKRLADDVALLTYRAAKLFNECRPPIHSLRCSIWRRSSDRWQIVYHQGTPVD